MDYYDDDLPKAYKSWVDSFRENKEGLLGAGKIVSIPTGLFLLTCIANYFINKKLDSL